MLLIISRVFYKQLWKIIIYLFLNSSRSHWWNLERMWKASKIFTWKLFHFQTINDETIWNLKLGTAIPPILISLISLIETVHFVAKYIFRNSQTANDQDHHGASLIVPHGFRMPRVCRATLISILRRFLNSPRRWKAFHTGLYGNPPWSLVKIHQRVSKFRKTKWQHCCKVHNGSLHDGLARKPSCSLAEILSIFSTKRCQTMLHFVESPFRVVSLEIFQSAHALVRTWTKSRRLAQHDYLYLTNAHFLGRYSTG